MVGCYKCCLHTFDAYPVLPKYATATGTYHVSQDVLLLLEELLLTYSNADHLSWYMYRAMNEHYKQHLMNYLGMWCAETSRQPRQTPHQSQQSQLAPAPRYPVKDGQFMTTYPPSGFSLHDLFAAAQSSNFTLSGIADKNRHEREL